MKRYFSGVCFGVFVMFSLLSVPAQALDKQLLKSADQLRDEQSYQMALGQYHQLESAPDLNPAQAREIRFKIADCAWRADPQNPSEAAEKTLKDLSESSDHDRWWGEANESLAELYLKKDVWGHQNDIRQALENARLYWAGATDLELARQRFIRASFTLGDLLSQHWGWYYTGVQPLRCGMSKPLSLPPDQPAGLEVLYEEILKVAKSDADKARAAYGLAMSYMNRFSGDKEKQKKTEKYFQEIIKSYPQSEWVDDAYYHLAQSYERLNDFNAALEQYQALLARFRPGESQWVDDAQRRVKDITQPALAVNVPFTFIPGSEIQFSLNWRNVNRAQVTLYKIDLVNELSLDTTKPVEDSRRGVQNYPDLVRRLVESRRYVSLPMALTWEHKLKDEAKHLPYGESKGLADWQKPEEEADADPQKGMLAPGAYLLLVQSGETMAYDLVLVTDLGLMVKSGGQSALIYAFDAQTGRPRPQTRVKYHYSYYNEDNQWRWEEAGGVTDEHGLLKAELKSSSKNQYNARQHQLFVTAQDAQGQSFSQGYSPGSYDGKGPWWLYAFSDRPAYRPREEVSFKAVLRQDNGQEFVNPSGLRVKARILGPQGNMVREGTHVLNDYGAFADRLTLDDQAALGEYRLELLRADDGSRLTQSPLFRLEEYKLPEFMVTVKPQPRDGQTVSTYRLGDTVDVAVEAHYYFGGAVADAEVEYLVYQRPYYPSYSPQRDYAWYYDDMTPRNHYYGSGQLVTKGTVKTDKDGRAAFSFETPKDSPGDFAYRVEARVVDQSRREISASGEVKVTRTPYYAYLTPKQYLYRPGDKAEVTIKTMTANDEPVAVEAKVTVSRNWWSDPVVRPKEPQMVGALVEDKARRRAESVPGQVVEPGHYTPTVLFTQFVKTNAQGEAVMEFQPDQDGYYTVEFTAFEKDGQEVKASANVFVCDRQSRDIGYRYGGLQLIAEKDTYRVGETARVMVVSDEPQTWALISSEAGEIFDYQMVELSGTVKLLEIPIKAVYTPNIFLNAVSAGHYQLKAYSLPIIVPPEEKFLQVKITSDKEVYQPQEEGQFVVEVTDSDGQPVAGDVALGVVDASVYDIQGEYAPDIRQFFYGDKRQPSVQTQASFYQRRYVSLMRGEEDRLILGEDKPRESGRKDKARAYDELQAKGDEGFAVGGARANAQETVAASPSSLLLRNVEEKQMTRDFKSESLKDADMNAMGAEASLATPQVRSDFRSTVLWLPSVTTDAQGQAKVTVRFPDSLTAWRTTARAVTRTTSVGTASQEVRTKKDILVRLQAPRFFTERDRVTISANVHNDTDTEQDIKVTLEAKGLQVENGAPVMITVPAHGEQRVDWSCTVPLADTVELKVLAQAKTEADAMVKTYPVLRHGIEKFIARSVAVKDNGAASTGEPQSAEFVLDVPKERIKEATSLELVLSPSMSAAMLDALPYLADYPYGCVEQTMSRFLPTVIVAKTLKDLGISGADVMSYISDVLEPRGDPDGHPQRRPGQTATKVTQMAKDGLNRLYDFQHSDGGWGWWKDDDSDRFMSAYVVWGMSLARQAGISVREEALSRGVRYLQTQLVEEEDHPDMLAWMLHALAQSGSQSAFETKQTERLWQMRDQLNPYTRALFALAQFSRRDMERAQVLARNLGNGIKEDTDNGTAHWGESGIYYRWSEGGVEATAFTIKALANIDPQSAYLPSAVKWLALNRRGGRWSNTRDTAMAILGLADYLKTTNELQPDYDFEILVNGASVRQGHVDRSNLFTFSRTLTLPPERLLDGKNTVRVVFKGAGALYLSGYLKYFTLEEDITPASHEIAVQRQYSLQEDKETLLQGFVKAWTPLASGDTVKSGERIKVELNLEAKNNYEYLIFEDYKPAGLEAVELKSGATFVEQVDDEGRPTGKQVWAYQEFRDNRVVTFITKLPQGKYRLSYELRAEVPGAFHGMPNVAHAMYVPEIRANSSETRVTVVDR